MVKKKSFSEHMKNIDDEYKKKNRRVKKGITRALDEGKFPFQK